MGPGSEHLGFVGDSTVADATVSSGFCARGAGSFPIVEQSVR